MLITLLVHLLALLQELPRAAGISPAPIFKTDKGRVKCLETWANTKKVDVCWGIPFAKPPLNELRFKHPLAADPWDPAVHDATSMPNSCIQGVDTFFGNFSGSIMWNPNTPVDEDCLYLNVWVPRTQSPFHYKAVMVWIYGGCYFSGTSTLTLYDGKYLAAENDVIVVSFNYRVGSIGFLNLNTPEAPGNAGMMDQRMALEWVQNNIGYFGGSPDNVTIFGESAGATSVGMHLLSPLSQTLFTRAILQSGAPQTNWATNTMAEGRRRSLVLARTVKCDNHSDSDIVDCLRNQHPMNLLKNEYSVTNGVAQFPFVPIVDGVFLPDSPTYALQNKRFKKTQLLLGSDAQEGTWFLMYENELIDMFSIHTESLISQKNMEQAINTLFTYHPKYPTQLNRFGLDAIMFQYTDWANPEDQAIRRDNIAHSVGDYHFVCEVNKLADFYAANGQRVYQFWFDHRSSVNPWPKWMGTLHGDEIHFVFGMPLNPELGYNKKEQELSKRIMRYWSNFAKTGDPNRGPGELSVQEWPEYRPLERQYLNLSLDILTSGWRPHHRAVRGQQCAFWNHYLPNLIAGTSDMSDMEKEWKTEFHEWKTRYIVDWKNQFDNFLNNYEKRLKTCGTP